MEKDLKDKKPAENGTPKVPWTKMIPAAAVIAALAFSGIKAKGSEESTEAVQKAETTVMSASELEKYLGYEERKTVHQRKAHQRKVLKKQQQKKVLVRERFQNQQKAMPVRQDRVLPRPR